MDPIDEAMKELATKSLNNEAGSMICIQDGGHVWRYNKHEDEVYCMSCGGVDVGYRGMGVTLLEIKKLLIDISSNGLGL